LKNRAPWGSTFIESYKGQILIICEFNFYIKHVIFNPIPEHTIRGFTFIANIYIRRTEEHRV